MKAARTPERFRVRSYDLQRWSTWADWCEFTVTLPDPALDPPTTIHATGAELSWPAYANPDEPFTQYQVHRGSTANFTPSEATRVTSLPTDAGSFTDTTAPPTPADAPAETGSTVYYKLAVKTEGGTLVASPARAVALPKAGQTTKIFQSGPSVSDTTLSAAQPSTNLDSLGGKALLEVGNNGLLYGDARAVVEFGDLSAVPPGARVVDADLGLWATAMAGAGERFDAHALTRDFSESSATWNQAATGTPWTTPGGDFTPSPTGSLSSISGAAAWKNWDVTSAVSGWQSSPASNHGLLVKTANEAAPTQRISFASSEAADTAQRPRLVVTYLTASTASTYYAPHTPQLMVPNQDEQVQVTVTNTTAGVWDAEEWVLSYRWLNPDGTVHKVPAEGGSLPNPGTPAEDMSPGEQLNITRTVKPPVNAANAGRSEWVLAWDMRNLATNQWLSQLESIPPLQQTVAVEDPGEIKGGLENFYQYTGQPTGAGSAVLVNQHSGNSVFSYDVFSNPSRGVNTFLRMTYNSRDKTNEAAGYGWSVSGSSLTKLGAPLAFGPPASGHPKPGSVYLTDGDGSLHEFVLDEQTGEYRHPTGVRLYLQKLTPGAEDARAWVMTAPDRTKFYFNADGYHIATVDRNGNTLSLNYDPLPQNPGNPKQRYLTGITDPDGRTTLEVDYYLKGEDYTYIDDQGARQPDTNLTDPDIYGSIKSITDISAGPDGAGVADRTVTFYYTRTGLLAEMVDGRDEAQAPAAQKKVLGFDYDPNQTNTNTKLTAITDPRGNTTRLDYYAPPPGADAPNHWKVHTISDRKVNAGVTEFAYTDPDGQAGGEVTSTVTDAEGRDTSYTLDAFGRPVEIVDAKSQTTKLTWDGDHHVVKLEEPPAQPGGTTAKTQWVYDQATGYPLVMIDAEANGATFDPNPLTSTKPRTRFTYQTSLGGHVADLDTKTSPLGHTWDFGYDGAGNLISVTDPEGVATTGVTGDFQSTYSYHLDDSGQPNGLLDTTTDANGHTTRFDNYDANGFPRLTIDAAGNDTVVDYDARGAVVSVTDANNHTGTHDYDLFGRPGESRVPMSDTQMIITPAPRYD